MRCRLSARARVVPLVSREPVSIAVQSTEVERILPGFRVDCGRGRNLLATRAACYGRSPIGLSSSWDRRLGAPSCLETSAVVSYHLLAREDFNSNSIGGGSTSTNTVIRRLDKASSSFRYRDTSVARRAATIRIAPKVMSYDCRPHANYATNGKQDLNPHERSGSL